MPAATRPLDHRSSLTQLVRPEERAIEEVVGRYQRVAPAVTRFARTLSGNPQLVVRLGPESSSGADEIVCDPRVFQAAYAVSAPVTPDEVAIASALHEVVHLVATDLDERRPVPDVFAPHGVTGESDLIGVLRAAGGSALEALFFALEDARQERVNLAVYPGARSVLADIYSAASQVHLGQARPLGQFALACFLMTGGYEDRDRLERRVDGRVAVALADAAPYVEQAAKAADPWDVAVAALMLLEVASLHGLVKEGSPAETVMERKDRQENDRRAVADGVDRVRLASPVLRDAEGYEETRRSAQSRAGDAPRRADSEVAGQEGVDQLLRVSQAPTIYLPNGMRGRLLVTPIPDQFRSFGKQGREALDRFARRWQVAQRHVSGELYPLFVANQRRGLRSGYDAGDLSPHAALFIGAGLYERIYERRALPNRRSYAVSLLVDASASMLQPRPAGDTAKSPWGMAAALLGAWTLARLCDELQVEFEVALFNRSFAARRGDTEARYTASRSRATAGLRQTQGAAAERLISTVNHYVVKPFGRRWRDAEDVLAGLFRTAAEPAEAAMEAKRYPNSSPPVSMFEKAANVDEFNVIHAAERMARTGSTVRVLVVLADGMTRGSVEALAAAVNGVEHGGTTVLGIGIGDATVEAAYRRSEVVSQPEALTRAIVDGTRQALRRSLAMWGMEAWWQRASRTPERGLQTIDQ